MHDPIDVVRAYYDRLGAGERARHDAHAHARLVAHLHEHFMLSTDVNAARGPLRVLDVGCGSGRFALPWAARGARVTLVDLSSAQLQLARAAFEGHGLSDMLSSALQADARRLTALARDRFDLTLCYGSSLCYLRAPAELALALRELVRVTRPGGHVIVSVGGRYGLLRHAAARDSVDPAGFFGQPEAWFIDQVLTTGDLPAHPEVDHPPRRFFTGAELRDALAAAGLHQLELATAPAVTAGLFHRLDAIERVPEAWATILRIEEAAYREPGLVDAGAFILARGRVAARHGATASDSDE